MPEERRNTFGIEVRIKLNGRWKAHITCGNIRARIYDPALTADDISNNTIASRVRFSRR